MPESPSLSVLTAVTASTAISEKKTLSGPKIFELMDVFAALMRFGLNGRNRGKNDERVGYGHVGFINHTS